MGIIASDLREMITDVLRAVDTFTDAKVQLLRPDAVEILMLTCAQESHCGRYLRQIKGPARGIYQMEPPTDADIWKNVLAYNKSLRDAIQNRFMLAGTTEFNLRCNNAYATIMARLQYWRHREKLPSKDDIPAMADYYKRHFNTVAGKATVGEAVRNYRKYVLEDA